MNKSPEKYPGPSVVAVDIATELLCHQHRTSQEYLRTDKKNPYPVGVVLVTQGVVFEDQLDVVIKGIVTGFGSSLAVTITTELDN